MKWINASERLPSEPGIYKVKKQYSQGVEDCEFTGSVFTNYDCYKVVGWLDEKEEECLYKICKEKATEYGKLFGKGDKEKETEAHNHYFNGFWECVNQYAEPLEARLNEAEKTTLKLYKEGRRRADEQQKYIQRLKHAIKDLTKERDELKEHKETLLMVMDEVTKAINK